MAWAVTRLEQTKAPSLAALSGGDLLEALAKVFAKGDGKGPTTPEEYLARMKGG